MTTGWLNPKDNPAATGTRPAHVDGAAGARRWFDDDLATRFHAQDMNAVLAALRVLADYYGVTDAEGNDNAVQTAVANAVANLRGGQTDVAAAATTNIGAVNSTRVRVTGSGATIASLGGSTDRVRLVRFADVNTIVHNAVTLILPGGKNIVTAAGDTGMFISGASGNWSLYFWQPGSGAPLDFEVGSVASPVVDFLTNGDFAPTYTYRELTYIRWGNLVWFTLAMKFTANAYTTASGQFRMISLPFQAANPTDSEGYPVSGWLGKLVAASSIQFVPYVVKNTSWLRFKTAVSGAATANITTANVPASVADYIIHVSGVYERKVV